MAQLILGAAGAGLGFLIGGPLGAQFGWAIGSMLGAPTQKSRGPQLTDLRVTGTESGAPIPYVFAHPRIAPYRVLWVSERRAIDSTSSSKGGGVEVTNTTYVVDVWFGLTDNPLPDSNVRRIWENGKLEWTAADDADDASLEASANTDKWERLTFYDGNPSQLPDPTYESAVGTANAVAHRRRRSVFMEGLQLGGVPALLPNFTFELGGESFSQESRLDAPLTADGEDTVTPPATLTTLNGSYISYSAAGASMIPPIGPSTDSSLTWGPVLGGKLNVVTNTSFAGRKVTLSATVLRPGIDGTGTGNSLRFFGYIGTYAGNGAEVSFASQVVSNVEHIVSFYYIFPTSYPVDHGSTTSNDFKIVFSADGATIKWYIGGALVRTETQARFEGQLYVQAVGLGAAGAAAVGVSSWLFKDVLMFGGGLSVPLVNRTLQSVVEELCTRAGLSALQFDASALATITKPVRALAISQVGNTRVTLELLMSTYFFECYATDKLYFVPRGGSVLATIPYAHLGAANDPSGAAEPLALKQGNDLEIACQVLTTCLNVNKDYQSDTQESSRLANGSETVNNVQLPLGFTPAENKGIAQTMVLDTNVARVSGTISLLGNYTRLTPTDVVNAVGSDGSTYRIRLVQCSDADGVLTFPWVLDDASALVNESPTSTDDVGQTNVTARADTLMELMDIPILRDADDKPGFYAAAKGTTTNWAGAKIFGSPDDIDFTTELVTIPTPPAIFGECTTTLGNWTGIPVVDELNSVTVDVDTGELASSTRDAMFLDATINAMLIGSEIIRFVTATLQSAGIYKLTRLFRGQRGTEWAMAGHAANERCVLLRTAGLRHISHANTNIGVQRYYKGVTLGRRLSSATSEIFTDTGIALKPFSPVHLRKGGDDSQVTVTWKRRTRLATRFAGSGGISVPLGETSEAYYVELRSPSNVLVSSEIVNAAQWSGASVAISGSLFVPAWGIKTISSELVAIRDDLTGIYTTPKFLVRFDTTGALIAQSNALGNEVYQWCNNGDELFVATADFTNGVPVTYANGKVQRITRTALGTVAATYTAATAGDPAGVATDGTNVFMTERYGGKLRKLNISTLASITTYTLNVGLGALYHDSGSLWICSTSTNEVVQWSIAGASETLRFSVVNTPFDLLIVGSLVFVLGAAAVGVYDKSTGALVTSVALTPPSQLAQRSMCLFGSYVAVSDISSVVLLDSTTGLRSRSVDTNTSYFFYTSGAYSTTLYLTVGAPGQSSQTLGYELAAPALTGYTLTVAQVGANGNGYSASLTL